MHCDIKTDMLERFVDDDLDYTEHKTIKAHIALCPHCKEHVDGVLQVRVALQESTAQQVSSAPLNMLWARIERELDQTGAATTRQSRSVGERLQAWWLSVARPWAVTSAVTALGVVLGIWALHSPNNGPEPPANVDTMNHAFVMESYEVLNGTVIIDVDPEGEAPAVLWHFIDEEEHI